MGNMPKGSKTPPQPAGSKPSAFAEKHCMDCAAGWTRTRKDGGLLIVCLLDREPVLADMIACDRYEPKDEQPI